MAGASVNVSGAGFPPLRLVDLTLDGTLLTIFRPIVRSDGTFTGRVTIPSTASVGRRTLRAAAGTTQISIAFDVVSASGAPATATTGHLRRSRYPPRTHRLCRLCRAPPLLFPAAPSGTATPTRTATAAATATPQPHPGDVHRDGPTDRNPHGDGPGGNLHVLQPTHGDADGTHRRALPRVHRASPNGDPDTYYRSDGDPHRHPRADSDGAAQRFAADQVHNLVNSARAAQGLPPLAYDGALAVAAQSYAQLMANSGCFSHSCPPVTYFVDRVVAAG